MSRSPYVLVNLETNQYFWAASVIHDTYKWSSLQKTSLPLKNCPYASLFISEVSILYDSSPHLVLTKAHSVCWDYKRWIKRESIHHKIYAAGWCPSCIHIFSSTLFVCFWANKLNSVTALSGTASRKAEACLGLLNLARSRLCCRVSLSSPVQRVEMLLIYPNSTLRGSIHKADLSCNMGTVIMPLTYFRFSGSEQELKA